MEQERKCLRIGLLAIAAALILRIAGSGVMGQALRFLTRPDVASFLLYLETGRIIRVQPPEAPPPADTQPGFSPSESAAAQPEPLPCFGPGDADSVAVHNSSQYPYDLNRLLSQPLQWDLTEGGPAVLILHTHATESYTQTPDAAYKPSSDYRTLDEAYNMLGIGDRLATLLEAGGIQVLHDRTLHDYPDYTGAYSAARSTIRRYLKEYPSIRMVLDLHRDASDTDSKTQLKTAVTLDGKDTARLMMVVGTDANGLSHPKWQENMALAVKLHAALERQAPGLCRPISFRAQRFNQDLSLGAMLIEVGAAGDTFAEALAATEQLAQGILTLARGTATENSPS